jgi:hypothetical protein
VKADVKQLVEAFPLTWPQYEVTAAASLDGLKQLWRWKQSNERSLTVADDPFRHVRLSPGAARYDQAYPP